MNTAILLAGGACGLGVALLVRELLPAPPDLQAALDRIDGRRLDGGGDAAASGIAGNLGAGGWAARLAAGLAGRLPVPRRDLDLLARSVDRFMLDKLLCLLLGLTFPAIAGFLGLLLFPGSPAGWALPAAAGLGFAIVLFFVPDYAVHADATRRRVQFRHAISSYLDLVALERGAGAAPNQALENAAQLSHGWAFSRIAAVLEQARRTQVPPWEGLARLSGETDVGELADLADIAELAGNEGARILDTLIAKAESMRAAAMAESIAQANSRTTTMVIPIALLGMAFLLLLTYPVLYRLLTT
ncbi:type II secretion system F family protein [Acrocarpospora sp. B8E8]|uniref:type II secretion system F family protein n=1 Tax=Acrocarpospora sp. B8E8 TaxID=3153572 RepID=UPI00325CBE0E